jgi:DNA-binding NarL/FixJ family response regulator
MSKSERPSGTADIRVILLVPSDLVRDALALVLRDMDGIVVAATSWSAAVGIRLANTSAADVVIIDNEYPDIGDVIDMLRRVRPQTRVIVLAGSPIEQYADDVKAARPDGYAFKRLGSADLEAEIKRVMRERETGESA